MMCGTARGFTYIELLVSLALIGGLISLTAFAQSDGLARSRVRSERDTFASIILASARARALANVHEAAHGVRIDTGTRTYTLFEGTTFDPLDTNNRTVPFSEPHTTITSVNGNDTIIFLPRSGNVAAGVDTYTIALGSAALQVHVNNIGRIDW